MHKILIALCIFSIVSFQYMIDVEGSDEYIPAEKVEAQMNLCQENNPKRKRANWHF